MLNNAEVPIDKSNSEHGSALNEIPTQKNDIQDLITEQEQLFMRWFELVYLSCLQSMAKEKPSSINNKTIIFKCHWILLHLKIPRVSSHTIWPNAWVIA